MNNWCNYILIIKCFRINKKITETSQNSPCTEHYSYYIGQCAKKVQNDLFYHGYNSSSFIFIGYIQWMCIIAENSKFWIRVFQISLKHIVCLYDDIIAQCNLNLSYDLQPTHKLVLFPFFKNEVEICLLSLDLFCVDL